MILKNLPLLSMGAFSSCILLILKICLFADLYSLRKMRLFPDLPVLIEDTEVLSDYMKGLYPPGLSSKTSIRMHLYWEGCRSLTLLGGDGGVLTGRDRFQRGVYRVVSNDLILNERFGLFRIEIKGETGRMLRIQPGSSSGKSRFRTVKKYRNSPRTSRSVRKDSSFYESRQYFPGDDPRRINWKLKARHGDLFVKDGYFASPAGKTVIILINGQGDASRVDQLIRSSSQLIKQLAERGHKITLFTSGMKESLTLTAGEALKRRKDLLTVIPPQMLTLPPSLDFGEAGSLYLFSCADSLPQRIAGLSGGSPMQRTLVTDSALTEQTLNGEWYVIED